MSIAAKDPTPAQLPKMAAAYEEAARAEARMEIACAINQLELLARARVSLGMLAFAASFDEFYFLQSEFDGFSVWRWENAGIHAQLGTRHLFEAYADACWQTVRPDASKFLGFLDPIHVRVDREIRDMSQQLESMFGIPAIVERECGDKIQLVLDEKHAEWAERARFEGAVTDRKHWSQLQENFEALAKQEGHERPEHFLTAVGEYTASLHPTGTWILSGAEQSLRTQFELYGMEAGVALRAPIGVDPLTFFLHHLFRDSLVSRNRQASGDMRKGGYIRRVCPAAVMFCTKLQKVALENDHRLAAIQVSTPEPDAEEPMPPLRKLECMVCRWEQVEITFTSEERVRIKIGEHIETRNYNDFGFEDGRTGKPNRAWSAFRILAEQNGIVRDAFAGNKWPSIEKRMQELRRILRETFNAEGDPLPFVKGIGYRARFKICRALSLRS